jgi:DsbC/DsbD-like thiol-disulfide interchange protein
MSGRMVGLVPWIGLVLGISLGLEITRANTQTPSDLNQLKPGPAPAKRSDAVVKISTQSAAAEGSGRRRVSITLKIDDGWYIYGNPVGNAEMQGSETVVTLAGNRGKLIEVRYPEGVLRKEKLLDQEIEYRIYEGTVRIEAVVEAPRDGGPVELVVRFGACSHRGSCLQPASVKLPVK